MLNSSRHKKKVRTAVGGGREARRVSPDLSYYYCTTERVGESSGPTGG